MLRGLEAHATLTNGEVGWEADGSSRHPRCRSWGNIRALWRTRRSKRKQSRDGGDAASPAKRSQRHRAGFALPGSEPKAGAGTVARCDWASPTQAARCRNCRARKSPAPKITASTKAQEENSRIETKTRGTEKTSPPNPRLAPYQSNSCKALIRASTSLCFSLTDDAESRFFSHSFVGWLSVLVNNISFRPIRGRRG